MRHPPSACSPCNFYCIWWEIYISRCMRALGPDPATVAASLIERISASDLQTWRSGSTADWAWESFAVARVCAWP